MSEISDIPISRCSTVSRLDRIRTLWRCMLPLAASNKQRCVASGSAGRRAGPGPCPAWSRDEAFLPSVARWFMTQPSRLRENREKRNDLNYKELYNLTPSIHGTLQYACLNTVCVRNDFRTTAVWGFFLTFLAVLVFAWIFFFCVNLTLSSEWHWRLRLGQRDTFKTKIVRFFSHNTTRAFLSDVITTGVTLT